MYVSIAIIAILILVGGYLVIKGKQIREGELSSCGDGTVIYLNENLCWEKSTKPGNSDNWADANSYCDSLTLADNNDWRLPTKQELASIVEDFSTDISINENVFSNTEPKHYWSSDSYGASLHWYVHFEIGHEGYAQDFNEGYGARCVRDVIFY